MKSGPLNCSSSFRVYEKLVTRAVIVMIFSTLLTAVITAMVFSRRFAKDTVTLNIVDNACVLASIMLACDIKNKTGARIAARGGVPRCDSQQHVSSSIVRVSTEQQVGNSYSEMASM